MTYPGHYSTAIQRDTNNSFLQLHNIPVYGFNHSLFNHSPIMGI